MIAAPIPANEDERLASLRRMNLLCTPREADLVVVARGNEGAVGNSLGDKIMRTFRDNARLKIDGGEYPFTVSAGIALASSEQGPAFNAKALFDAADKALYRAKNGGRNRYEVVGPDAAYHDAVRA